MGKLNERLFRYNPEIINNNTNEGFIKFVKKFYEDVEYFFSQYPKSKFIIYNIENDNINKLKKYIDIKNIKKCLIKIKIKINNIIYYNII